MTIDQVLSANAPAQTDHIMNRAWNATALYRPVLVMVVALAAFFSFTQDGFADPDNIRNLLVSVATVWIIAMGMTFVLISGAIDLSAAATASVCGVVFAETIRAGLPGPLALVAGIVTGVLIGGVINGALIGKVGLSFFVVTLASATALTGVVQIWTDTRSIPVTAPIADQLAVNRVAGIPMPVILMIVTLIIAYYLQRHTYFGRDVFAIGGSTTAARLSGIRAPTTTVAVFALVGGCAGLAGIVAVSRIGAATPQVDQNLTLQAIAAVLLGGTSVFGGAGDVRGTVIGVLFIGVLQNGLSIAGVQTSWQLIVTGIILVMAVLGDRVRFRRRRPPAPPTTGGATSDNVASDDDSAHTAATTSSATPPTTVGGTPPERPNDLGNTRKASA